MLRSARGEEKLPDGRILMEYVCTHPLHRGWRVGRQIGDLPLDKCLRAKCEWLAVENEREEEEPAEGGHLRGRPAEGEGSLEEAQGASRSQNS